MRFTPPITTARIASASRDKPLSALPFPDVYRRNKAPRFAPKNLLGNCSVASDTTGVGTVRNPNDTITKLFDLVLFWRSP